MAFATAQTPYRVLPFVNKVIAKSGLNLRTGPNTKSEVITRIPYGGLVEISGDDAYGYDTLEVIKTEVNEFNISGYWIKVDYKGQTGYINNAYLHFNDKKWSYKDEHLYNQSIIFLEYRNTCNRNAHPISGYNWYGYYSDDCELRPIKLQYGRNVSDMRDFYIIVKEDEGLDWIVGSKEKLEPGPLDHVVKDFEFKTSLPYNSKMDRYTSYSEPYFDINYTFTDDRIHNFDIVIKEGLETQIVMDATRDGSLKGVMWMGDLDRDGRMDYILQYGDKEYESILYLSSKRISNRLITPVGRFHDGYCC